MAHTFRIGGIHPKANKLTEGATITLADLPQIVRIPISQHIGVPATALVKKNDPVKVGTLIAKSGGFVSANIHSSISGTVLRLEEVIDASGYKKSVITIQSDGQDSWEESIDRSTNIVRSTALSPQEIIQKIGEMGIVGMGGATFPTQVKLMPPKGSKADVLIINGVECEPFLTADHRIMLERTEEILIGVSTLIKALGVSKAVIGIEENKPDAIKKMQNEAQRFGQIEVLPLKVRYPQGGEKQLIDAVLHKQVKSGQLPISVGAVVQNVGTALAIYEAVMKNKPLIERVVTVTGTEIHEPKNYLVRIGTPIDSLITASGGMPDSTGKVISGGPMMGKALVSTDSPITKGTSGILVLPTKETKRKPMRNCIRCAKCVTACPMGLNPAFLMRDTVFQDWSELEKHHIMDCIECGSCSFTCPANRPLLDRIRQGKAKIGGIIRSRKSAQ